MAISWSLTIDCAQPARLATTLICEEQLQGRPDHVVMADPEGNEVCLV